MDYLNYLYQENNSHVKFVVELVFVVVDDNFVRLLLLLLMVMYDY